MITFCQMRERLYKYTNNNRKKQKTIVNNEVNQNDIVSLPAFDTRRQYKRLAPEGSPSKKKQYLIIEYLYIFKLLIRSVLYLFVCEN